MNEHEKNILKIFMDYFKLDDIEEAREACFSEAYQGEYNSLKEFVDEYCLQWGLSRGDVVASVSNTHVIVEGHVFSKEW